MIGYFLCCCNVSGYGDGPDGYVGFNWIMVSQEQSGCKGISDSIWMCEAHSFCEKGLITVRSISFNIATFRFLSLKVVSYVISAICLTKSP